ncbi:MAG: flavodoxin-dependent (E)-4-hydroxy-3-methylbut-2-enyl-diphosphate synthase [bacterium]
MNYERKKTREVRVGDVIIGNGSPISVQSMTKTKTADVDGTVNQIIRCADRGADIMRVTVNTAEAAETFGEIVRLAPIPIVADIHFNHVFALKAIEAGAAKIRINPGNIGNRSRIEEVLTAAKRKSIPIRIGVNSGSLEKDILEKHGKPTSEALFESAMRHLEICRSVGFEDIIIAVKSTNVPLMIDSYRLLSENTDYPLHLGVTEAGTNRQGTIKSAIGIGTLLSEGIGDTLRVSLTDLPEKEVETGIDILRALGLRKKGIEIISCPTCGRLDVDLVKIACEVEAAVKGIDKDLKVAIMGCIVNGPGEAMEADLGVACGKHSAIVFSRGEKIKTIPENEIVQELLEMIDKW